MSKFYRESDDFNQKQIKGIDLVVKATIKKYPFIKGWEFADNYMKYASTLNINLFVSFDEVFKFYGKEWNPFWERIYERDGMVDSSLILTFSSEYDNFKFDDESNKIAMQNSYDESKKIENYINNMYESLPEELRVKTFFDSSVGISEFIPRVYIERFIDRKND
jgi:hypothetical protein